MKLQVLVATMQQKDFSLPVKMNIRCDAIIANQAGGEKIVKQQTEYGAWKMITTPTRGVGLNRNIALMASEADVVLFADDDMAYRDEMPEVVCRAFEELPQADVLIFGIDIVKNGQIIEKRRSRTRRLHVWNVMRYGTVRVAARRRALLQKNITFHQSFGGGCAFGSGEDSLFLKSCLDAGLKIYSHKETLGSSSKDVSSWFVGYNDKYFYDKGVLIRSLFPRCAYLMALYFGARFKRETEVGLWKRLRLMYAGVRNGKSMKPYQKN